MTHEEIVTSHVAQRRALLPRPAADPLPLPDQGARRAAPARRRAAHARVHHEGLLHLRPRRARASTRATRSTSSAYDRIFDRCGLEWYRVESDVGMMGGIGAHEYMAPCPAGENDVALAPGYAANVEVASADAAAGRAARRRSTRPRRSTTPGLTTVAEVAGALGVPAGALLKAYPGDRRGPRAACSCVRARRPPRQRDQARERARRRRSGPRARTSSRERIGPAGLHRARSAPTCRSCSTTRVDAAAPTSPAPTATDAHLRGVEPGRDFPFERADVRTRRGGRHRRRRSRSASSPRSRSATSSSSARATPSRSARPTSTRTGSEQLDLDGLLRHRPGAHRRRRGRAVRRRAGHLVAALARAVRRRSSSALGKPGTRGARAGRAALRRAARGRARRALRRPRRRPGREVRRRRAARLPAAADGRASARSRPASSRRRCGAAARSARVPLEGAAEAVARAVAEPPVDDAPADVPAAVGPRPLRPAAAADAAPARRCTRGRSRTRSASSGSR